MIEKFSKTAINDLFIYFFETLIILTLILQLLKLLFGLKIIKTNCDEFPEASSNCWFSLTDSLKSKNINFTVT